MSKGQVLALVSLYTSVYSCSCVELSSAAGLLLLLALEVSIFRFLDRWFWNQF